MNGHESAAAVGRHHRHPYPRRLIRFGTIQGTGGLFPLLMLGLLAIVLLAVGIWLVNDYIDRENQRDALFSRHWTLQRY